MTPQAADIIDRAIHDTDLMKDFPAAADVAWHTPAGPHRAVLAALEIALDHWAYDNGLPAATLTEAVHRVVTAQLTARCWSEYRQSAPDIDPVFDALCQANDMRRGMSI